jgi:hypothetical protein
MSNKVLELWDEIKTLVESVDLDVNKTAGGNVTAGVRARKGLRLMKTKVHELVKESVKSNKEKE